MSKSYPHRQTAIIAVICVLIVAGTILYTRPQILTLTQKSSWKNAEIKAPGTQAVIDDLSNTDWKKAFASASTTNTFKSTTKTASPKETPLTLTDQLSRDFFARYVELKQANLSGDQSSVQTAVDQSLTKTVNSANQPKTYNLSNVVITEDVNVDAIRKYGNSIGTAFVTYGPKANPVVIAENALDKNDLDLLKNIKPVTASYDKMIKAVLGISAPRPLANYHLSLVNALNAMLFVSQGLENISDDPVQSMVALDLYTPSQDAIRLSLLKMNDYFNTNLVYFTNTEPGILFATVPL